MSKRSALIIEDDFEDLKKIKNLLGSRNITYDFVDNSIEAIAKIKGNNYSFIILDLNLGGGDDDGRFLLDQMHQMNLTLPTIIVSNTGFFKNVMALKGSYEFVLETFDKQNLSEMLPLFDKVLKNADMQESSQSSVKSPNTENKVDSQKVFVVHGRNSDARSAMFQFLRSIDLKPIEWSQAVQATGKASPYVGEILDAGFSMAQAIVVLMTPDDVAKLQDNFINENDEQYERELTPQARPNVIFEAGMAMGINADRTVLVQMGKLRPFSDISGLHIIKMDNNVAKRQELAKRLETAGCVVNLDGTDWHNAGDFKVISDNASSTTETGK